MAGGPHFRAASVAAIAGAADTAAFMVTRWSRMRANPGRFAGSLLLLDALADYSKMDGMSLDRMARAFEVFHREWPELRLLP